MPSNATPGRSPFSMRSGPRSWPRTGDDPERPADHSAGSQPAAESPAGDRGTRERPVRLANARQAIQATVGAVPRVIGLVWSASPILTIGLATATILAGIVPAATAYVAKLLIDAVVRGIAISANAALPA